MMTDTENFDGLGLSEQMLEAVAAKGFETPTPIQRLTIPRLLDGTNDIIAQSQTGTGKTAAFGLPILQQIERDGKINALILVPTRELALQVTEELISYNKTKHLTIGAIYGGASMSEQLRRLNKGLDIVVGTPGRILDHIRRATIDLSQTKFMILDEADEMLNMGFIEDVEEILAHVNEQRRVLLFSATMPQRIIDLSKKYMRDVEILRVESPQLTTDLTDQIYFEVRESDKFDALTRIIDIQPEFYGIVFCRTKINVDEVSTRLIERGYAAEALHGDISQAQREKILKNFKNKRINILVATDVAARGIDVSNLTHVINYSLPQDSESYVHRIGRTGRAGNQGTAITFISKSEFRQFGYLKRDIKADIKLQKLPSPQDIVAMKRQKIKDDIQEIIGGGELCGDYDDIATELLEQYAPQTALSALLRLAFRDELDESNYPEIRSFSVDRRGTARLFVAIGRDDGYDARKIIALLKRECNLRDKNIDDLRMFDKFSFVSVPFADAEHVIHRLNGIRKGDRPIARIAKDDAEPKGRGRGGRKEGDNGESQFDESERPARGTRHNEDANDKGASRHYNRESGREDYEQREGRESGERYKSNRDENAQKGSSTIRVPRKSELGGEVRPYREMNRNTKQSTQENYVPDQKHNEGFDWSFFEQGGNTWERPTSRKSERSTSRSERSTGKPERSAGRPERSAGKPERKGKKGERGGRRADSNRSSGRKGVKKFR